MPNLESSRNQFNDDDALAEKKASANLEIEQANYLYSQVLKMSQDWASVDVVKAQLIIAYGQDAVESFGRTNHEKKVELSTIIEKAEQIVPPDSIESLKKRAETVVLKIVYPRSRRFRNALLVTVGLFTLISIAGTSLVPIRSLFRKEVEPTPLTGIHFRFDPPSPVVLTGNSIEVKAIVLDKDDNVIDIPVSWSAKDEADYNWIGTSQEGNTVKINRKSEANDLGGDLPLIIELIVKTKPSRSDAVFTDGINLLVRPTSSAILNRPLWDKPEQIHLSFAPALAALVSFTSDPQGNRARRPIVYLMDTRVTKEVVYSQRTWDIGATNAHDIRTILGDLPIDSRVEPVNPDWRGEKVILDANPDLIIIHYSCFYGHSNPHDDEKRFQEFLRYIAQANNRVQFLVYSRAKTVVEKEPYGQHRYLFPLNYERRLNIAGLRNRIHPFHIKPASGSFTDTGTALSLKTEVKRILGLP